MAASKRILLLIPAVIALLTAFVLTLNAGLPERAAFTGRLVLGGSPIAPEINAFAPAFEGRTLDGRILRLSDLYGKPVIINFWATWCEPCRVEMPDLQHVYDQYQGQGLRLLAVNLGESPNLVRQWSRKLGLTFDIILDEQQSIAALYYLRGQPSTYVVSPDGIITQIFYGPTTQEALQAALAPVVK